MNAAIQIHYITNENKVLRSGTFPMRGRKKEIIALEFWKWIKEEHPYECTIEKIICNEEDITETVQKLDKTSLN